MSFYRHLFLTIALLLSASAMAQSAGKLRILTWEGYVPADVAEDFRKETGIEIEVTLSSNEDIIARLRASEGAGFDLAQPSQDRVTGPQRQFHLYRPIDLSRVKTEQFLPEILDSAKANTTVDGRQYGVPFLWGAEGMVVNTRHAAVTDYLDLCKPELHGKTALRLLRGTLIAFAFAMGKDPFALYADPPAYSRMLDEVEQSLIACKRNLHFVFDSQGQIQGSIRAGDVYAAMLWDAPAWELGRENPYVRFINPKSGGLAWLMTSVLPAKGQNDSAAYAWINYTMRPEIAARITKSVGNFTAARGTLRLVDPRLKAQFFKSYPDGFSRLHWYPAIPAGIEDMETRTLARVRAAH